MRDERFHVVDDLLVISVESRADGVGVTVDGGDGSVEHIDFLVEDPTLRAAQRRILDGWRLRHTPVTYVRTSRSAALVDPVACFEQAYQS